MSTLRPEIGRSVVANGLRTNYLEAGEGRPVVLIHGSGPGVSAWANWQLVMPEISQYTRAIAYDVPGFGFTELDPNACWTVEYWRDHLQAFLDALTLPKVSFIGNSFGAMLAAQFAARYPDRVDRLVLMGGLLLPFPIGDALDRLAWGYERSRAWMGELLRAFPYDPSIVTEELVEKRFQTAERDDYHAAYRAMFPQPRQHSVDTLTLTPSQLSTLACPTLLLHGREDRMIPVDVSLRAAALIPRAELHVFGQCGHWVMIERTKAFCGLVRQFLS